MACVNVASRVPGLSPLLERKPGLGMEDVQLYPLLYDLYAYIRSIAQETGNSRYDRVSTLDVVSARVPRVAGGRMQPRSILGALALASVASAQGSLGGPQSSCSASQAFQYLGCYGNVPNGDHAGFSYEVSPYSDNPRFYPGFSYDLLTVEMCLTACRGHGFKYAGMYARYLCFCSSTAPTAPTSQDQCHGQGGCNGNPSEFCGSGLATDVYVDPSFQAYTPSAQASNYNYIGCFTTQNPGDFYNDGSSSTLVSSAAECFTRCSNRGYAYAGMLSQTECACGTDFEVGLQAQSEGVCSNACLPTDIRPGCGGPGGYMSAYVNRNLLGCYVPPVPGRVAGSAFTPVSSAASSTATTPTSIPSVSLPTSLPISAVNVVNGQTVCNDHDLAN
ncbi:MAG: hypothetical protein M1816_005125 [Peltula sp. TS41687]|nr:MAG: hypothetical protein M1816_005125 [Peltula sp. TS41687]